VQDGSSVCALWPDQSFIKSQVRAESISRHCCNRSFSNLEDAHHLFTGLDAAEVLSCYSEVWATFRGKFGQLTSVKRGSPRGPEELVQTL